MTALNVNDFLYSGNHVYIAEMYQRFLDDPGAVDPRWQEFFRGLGGDLRELLQERKGASWAPSSAGVIGQDVSAPASR